MRTITILSGVLSVPEDASVSVHVGTSHNGSVHECYGRERVHAVVTVRVAGVEVQDQVLLALGSDGYGHGDPIRPDLYRRIHELRCPLERCSNRQQYENPRRAREFDPEPAMELLRVHMATRILERIQSGAHVSTEDVIRDTESYFAQEAKS